MFNRFLAFLAVFILAAGFFVPNATASNAARTIAAAARSASDLPLFDSESAAQAHCPSDQVVWLNTKSGIYHEKGMRWYGRTRHGAYVCRKEADAAGYRDTRNGQ